jgi:hypothetical protein
VRFIDLFLVMWFMGNDHRIVKDIAHDSNV